MHFIWRKLLDCAIWLNRKKIFTADEISANFDIAAIRGYFLGGSLIKWLCAHNGQAYADKLALLDENDPALNDKLTEIFTQKQCNAPVHKADEQLIRAIDAMRGLPAAASSGSNSTSGSYRFGTFNKFGSYWSGSFNYALLASGSFNYGSFSYGSFRRTWQWEWEWRYGSFRTSSFRSNSFSLAGIGGSYRYGAGSFSYGSFGYGSFGYSFGSYRLMPFGLGFDIGSYRGFPLGGSFRPISSDEYDEIMFRTLNMCPLDRFGYGIHLI